MSKTFDVFHKTLRQATGMVLSPEARFKVATVHLADRRVTYVVAIDKPGAGEVREFCVLSPSQLETLVEFQMEADRHRAHFEAYLKEHTREHVMTMSEEEWSARIANWKGPYAPTPRYR